MECSNCSKQIDETMDFIIPDFNKPEIYCSYKCQLAHDFKKIIDWYLDDSKYWIDGKLYGGSAPKVPT